MDSITPSGSVSLEKLSSERCQSPKDDMEIGDRPEQPSQWPAGPQPPATPFQPPDYGLQPEDDGALVSLLDFLTEAQGLKPEVYISCSLACIDRSLI